MSAHIVIGLVQMDVVTGVEKPGNQVPTNACTDDCDSHVPRLPGVEPDQVHDSDRDTIASVLHLESLKNVQNVQAGVGRAASQSRDKPKSLITRAEEGRISWDAATLI